MSLPVTIDRQVLLQAFTAEAASGSAKMVEALHRLAEEPLDEAARHRILCLVHSLQGNARLFGYPALARCAQAVEKVLEHEPLPWTDELHDLIAASTAAFRTMVPRVVAGGDELLPSEQVVFEGLEETLYRSESRPFDSTIR